MQSAWPPCSIPGATLTNCSNQRASNHRNVTPSSRCYASGIRLSSGPSSFQSLGVRVKKWGAHSSLFPILVATKDALYCRNKTSLCFCLHMTTCLCMFVSKVYSSYKGASHVSGTVLKVNWEAIS